VTLLDLLKENGRIELSLLNLGEGDKDVGLVRVHRGGEETVVTVEDVRFATGGAITLVHAV